MKIWKSNNVKPTSSEVVTSAISRVKRTWKIFDILLQIIVIKYTPVQKYKTLVFWKFQSLKLKKDSEPFLIEKLGLTEAKS